MLLKKKNATTNTLQAFDWQKQFEKRIMSATVWVVASTKELSLPQRRKLVKRIQEGMDEAAFHRDIVYGATEIRDTLMHHLGHLVTKAPTPYQARLFRQKIEDFAVWTATNAPAHQSEIQDTFWRIVPEDAPQKESIAAIAGQALGSCLHEYGL